MVTGLPYIKTRKVDLKLCVQSRYEVFGPDSQSGPAEDNMNHRPRHSYGEQAEDLL